jgi:tricorn protease
MKYRLALIPSMLLFLISTALSQSETRLLRFPAIHGEQIVFSYAGDLYTVSVKG